jgi:hypothetical protein
MSCSDWVLVGTSLFLGAVALFVPYLSEVVKRRLFGPELKVNHRNAPPFHHLTYWRSPRNPSLEEPVYYFRFEVVNEGKSQARQCEAVLEELWVYDASGKPIEISNFSPMNLRWSGLQQQFLDINPHPRKVFCDIGHVSSLAHQQREEQRVFVDVPGRGDDEPRFLFEQLQFPYSQPNCLAAGKYAIKISVYCENAEAKTLYFQISWSGKWQDREQEMFREAVVEHIDSV